MKGISTFSIGGIHPPGHKVAAVRPVMLGVPATVYIPLAQHIGAPATPVVQKGQSVTRGQLLARSASFVSACIHSPVSGTVKSIEDVVMPNGVPAPAIILTSTAEENAADNAARAAWWEALHTAVLPDTEYTRDDLRRIISQAGVVGLGGATFPTDVKLTVKPDTVPEILIINGCECEPYLMCDDAIMQEFPRQIIDGALMMARAAGAGRIIIGVEDNKPDSLRALRGVLRPGDPVEVRTLRTKYPQGGEKQLVQALTGRRIPSGALPLSVGVVVNNVATALAVFSAIVLGTPLTDRVITLTGDLPRDQRRNYVVAMGTPVSALPFTLPPGARMILGGPMMGRAAVRPDAPVTKGVSGVLVLEDTDRCPVRPCVRCGVCVQGCPMGLEPYLLAVYGQRHMWDEAREALVADCLECGACSYSCPSDRPLLDYIRLAKTRSRK